MRVPRPEDEAVALLLRAAHVVSGMGASREDFMGAAYSAWMEAHPAERERVENEHLTRQIAELRDHGRVGLA